MYRLNRIRLTANLAVKCHALSERLGKVLRVLLGITFAAFVRTTCFYVGNRVDRKDRVCSSILCLLAGVAAR